MTGTEAMVDDILVVDDDPHIREVICFALANGGMATRTAGDGASALAALQESPPELMILDIGMPEMDGFEVCRSVRKTSNLPILFLTARDDEIDKVVGLELGGDDYVTKPFSPRELVARVKAILKRTRPSEPSGPAEQSFRWRALEVDADRHLCRFGGAEVNLTASEFTILVVLIKRPEIVLNRGQIMQAVYGPNIHVADRTLDSHIRNIRRKLAEVGCENGIDTVHGVGLRLGACTVA